MAEQIVLPRSVPPILSSRIESERRRLQKAATVLTCLAIAWESGHDLDFADAVEVARDDILEAIDRLDLVNLEGRAGKPHSRSRKRS